MYGYEHASTNNNTVPSQHTWVDLLGQSMRLPVYNCSVPGASNQTILRRLQVALNYCERRFISPLFILQWSEFTRYETAAEVANFKCEDWPYIRPNLEIDKRSDSGDLYEWASEFYQLFDDGALYYETTKAIDHANAIASRYHVINCFAHRWDTPKWQSQFVQGDHKQQLVFDELAHVYENELDCTVNTDLLSHGVQAFNSEDTTANIHLMWKRINRNAWWEWPEHIGLKPWCAALGLELGPRGHPMESANRTAFEYAYDNSRFKQLLKG